MGNSFESLFSINSDQHLIMFSSLFLALLVARAFNTVFCQSILGHGFIALWSETKIQSLHLIYCAIIPLI